MFNIKKKVSIIKIISFVMFVLSLWSGYVSAENTQNNQISSKSKNIVIQEKGKDGNVTQTITLSPKEIKQLEKEKWFLKILGSIYKDNKKIFFWIISDKNIQKQYYADPIQVNFSSRNFYVNSTKNQFFYGAFLQKSEALSFLSDLKKWTELTIKLEGDKKVTIFNITPKNFLQNKNIKYEYIFKLIKGPKGELELKEVNTTNEWKPLFNISSSTTNYITKQTKIIPWLLWYSNTWQIILFAIIIVILIWTIIFWYLYKNLKKNN